MHGEQVQFGLEQAVSWPQLQSGPQVHGEHVQLGLLQLAGCSFDSLVMAISLSQCVRW